MAKSHNPNLRNRTMDEKVELLCSVEKFEARAEDDGKCVFQGYAIKWGVEARIGSYFIEKFAKGCFTDAMNDDDWDVRFMVEHDGLPKPAPRATPYP